MGFLELPSELQISIFSYNSAPELKVARAVCTKFRDNASVWLFRKIVACARYQAMGAFQRISESTVYGKYVKEIVFDGTAYNPDLAQSEYLYQHSADQFEELKGVVSWARRVRFRKYKELYKEQVDILTGHVLLQTLARALEWQLPNVSSLIYSPEPHHIPLEKKDMKEILPRGRTRSDVQHEGFHHMIGAIHVAQYTGIRDFTVDVRPLHLQSNIGTTFHVDVFRFRDPTHIEAGKFFFQHLKRINMSLALSSSHGSNGPVGALALECLANMATLLSQAKGLEDLSLHYSPWHPDPHETYGGIVSDGQPIFPYLGLGTTWPKLRSLELRGIFAEEKSFKKLIARHKATLTSLKFGCCSLFSGQWSNIVEDVVFGTNIATFVLDHVNEVNVGETTFAALSETEALRWHYEGRLMVTEEGERQFVEPPEKSIYAWRNPDLSMDES